MEGDAEVYVKHRDEMLRYATALVGPSEADDIVSTVVLRTLRRRSLVLLENPRAYLLKAVLNEARGVWRRRPAGPLTDLPAAEVPPELLDVLAAVWKLPVPGPHAGISSVPELADWLLANRDSEYFDPDLGVIEQLEADLAMASIDFPLDDEEVDQLWHGYAAADRAGRFVAETTDGITWTTRYEE